MQNLLEVRVKILSLTLTITLDIPIVLNTDMMSIFEHNIQSHHNTRLSGV